jgi:DNA-binding NtrC family response regulator
MPIARRATILLVEDDKAQRLTLSGFLKKKGYDVLEADSEASARGMAQTHAIDLLLTDLRLGGPDGIDLLNALRKGLPDLQAIVLTAYGTVQDAVRAMRAGAYDFVSKPVDLDRLEALIEKSLERADLSRENRDLKAILENTGATSALIGEAPVMRKVKELALKVAPSKASVLILGESGTGKEVLARSIHLASPRKNKPFVTVNCAALPESLIESELFGHEKGAFTGATVQKKGRFELANAGTIFLDEVGEIPLHIQVKLLNVLQSNRFERVGGTETITSDVRVISATNRDLKAQVERLAFREDLYYRLNVIMITMPPLRERQEDIPLLVRHFLNKLSDISGRRIAAVDDEVMKKLQVYSFPGNVREIENWIERAMVLADGDRLTREDFPEQLWDLDRSEEPLKTSHGQGLEEQVADLERALLVQALETNQGNQSAAARDLKITERGIRYKIKKHGL